MDGWINKTCCIHAVEYYLAIKRNEVWMHAMTWMDLESILSKRSQQQKNIA